MVRTCSTYCKINKCCTYFTYKTQTRPCGDLGIDGRTILKQKIV